MGVKDVWHVAGPCEERISLHSLRGKILAIDLAGWVVQNNMQPGMQFTVTRPHLRNIFFRINTLLGLDILPVVVLDGSCPEVKAATVSARNKQAWGERQNQQQSPKRQQRRQFTGVLRDCSRLLQSLGVPCVTAPGEAEAYCSALNRAGLVDAVVSDDSDCFCYGAKTVLRNFSTDPKSFSVSQYTSSKLRTDVGLSRQRMVIMALLLGCDYNLGGVAGVGREAVTKLFSVWGVPGDKELDKVMAWRQGDADPDVVTSKPVHCGTCGHAGSVANHRKFGCSQCFTSSNCKSSGVPDCDCTYHSDLNQKLLAEWNIKQKAVTSPGWPFVHVVKEFYRELSNFPSKFSWCQPQPEMFVSFCVKKMDWLQEYCVEKITDTVVKWQVSNPATALVIPVEILKKRIKSGENMFEVQWSSENPALPASFAACVSATIFTESYQEVYQQYLDKLEAKELAKKKPRKKREKENAPPKEKKSKSKKETKKQPTLDIFMKKDEIPTVSVDPPINDKIKLKPKNIVITKLISEDPAFNRKVLSKKLVTPDTSENTSTESFNTVDQNKTDSYVFKVNRVSPVKMDECSIILSDSMKEYMEDDDDSDLSEIIDEIVGNKNCDKYKKADKSYSTSTPTFNQLLVQASTNSLVSGSPLLRKVQKNTVESKVKASEVFDFSDMSIVLNECSSNGMEVEGATSPMAPPRDVDDFDNMNFSSEETFDEFDCLDNPSSTPLADRVRRNMK